MRFFRKKYKGDIHLPRTGTVGHGNTEYIFSLLASSQKSQLSQPKTGHGNNNNNNNEGSTIKTIPAVGVCSYLTFVRTIISAPTELLLSYVV